MNRQTKKTAEDAKRWIKSKQGQDALKKNLQEARTAGQKIEKSRQIDQQTIKEVFTI